MPHVKKTELRQKMRTLRKQVSLPEAEQLKIIQLFDHCIGANSTPKTIALYEKAGSEIDPATLVTELMSRGHTCVMPEIMDEQTIVFSAKPDIIITPLIAFDRQGNRLGQGGGYYDRYFEKHPSAIKIGLAYAEQETDQIPTEAHDQTLNWIITPKEAIKIT